MQSGIRIHRRCPPVLTTPVWWPAIIAVMLTLSTSCLADRLYTWTDSQGVTHITESPPPPNVRNQEVLEYRPRTDAELAAIEEEKEALKKQLETRAANQKANNARIKAQRASQQAADAEAAAVEAQATSEEFTKRASTNWRRYHRNKATIMRLEDEAETARREAQSAKESAQSAAERAEKAAEEANANRMLNSGTTSDPQKAPEKR